MPCCLPSRPRARVLTMARSTVPSKTWWSRGCAARPSRCTFCKVSLRRRVRPGDRWAPAACMATIALHAAGAMVMADEFEAAGLHSPIYFIPIVLTRASRVRFSAVWTVGADKERMKTRLAASFQSFRFALHYHPRHHRNVRNHCSLLAPVRCRERHHVRGHRCAGPPWA